jgi:hypothetical protein
MKVPPAIRIISGQSAQSRKAFADGAFGRVAGGGITATRVLGAGVACASGEPPTIGGKGPGAAGGGGKTACKFGRDPGGEGGCGAVAPGVRPAGISLTESADSCRPPGEAVVAMGAELRAGLNWLPSPKASTRAVCKCSGDSRAVVCCESDSGGVVTGVAAAGLSLIEEGGSCGAAEAGEAAGTNSIEFAPDPG